VKDSYSSPQRPSFEHDGLACYTLLSLFQFHTELETYFSENFIPHLSLSDDFMALDRLQDLFAYRFLCFSFIYLCFINYSSRAAD